MRDCTFNSFLYESGDKKNQPPLLYFQAGFRWDTHTDRPFLGFTFDFHSHIIHKKLMSSTVVG
jgi:hypothetical protein